VNPDTRTAVIVVIAIIAASVLLSVLVVSAVWSSCSKWDIDAPDLRVGGSALTHSQECEAACQERMRADIAMRVSARAVGVPGATVRPD
jgi:hypothetical protein